MCVRKLVLLLALLVPALARAQYQGTERPSQGDSVLVLTLDDAIKIALSENTSVKVADMEIQRQQYARKGTYAALFPQVNGTGSYQRTIKKQVMYMGGGDDGASRCLTTDRTSRQWAPSIPLTNHWRAITYAPSFP